uniref:Uncharacterized protein n=1 Tax=Bird gammacoronavirus AnasCN24 TaxID=3237959 RepID=A0AB39AD17_9GAMC
MLPVLFASIYLTFCGFSPVLRVDYPLLFGFVEFCFCVVFNIIWCVVFEHLGFVSFYRHTLL